MKVQDREYWSVLNTILDEVYDISSDVRGWSWSELAAASGVSVATVYAIGNRQRQCPYFRTVWKLARAVGLELRLSSVRPSKRSA